MDLTMPPRRIGARGGKIVYNAGDYVEYQYKGSTVTGKLKKKLTNGHGVKPVWLVSPSDRRRKDEDIAEAMLGKIITAKEATFNRAPKLRPPSKNGDSSGTDGGGRGPVSPSSSNTQPSDGSVHGGRNYSPRGDAGSKPAGFVRGKRKSEESDETSGIDRVKKAKRSVTFVSQGSNTTTTTNASRKKPAVTKVTLKIAKKVKAITRIGTRSSGEIAKMPELPPPVKRSKIIKKVKSAKKEEAYKVVKMLTGTLYLYRGDRPRAEFIRFK